MTQFDSRRLLQSVTRLTENGSVRALEAALITTLREIIAATSVEFWSLHEDPRVSRRALLRTGPNEPETGTERPETALESEPAFAECLRTGSRVVMQGSRGSGMRIIHPARARRGVEGFLVVECEHEEPKDQEIVAILLRFYRNYATLLHDSQRDELTGLMNRRTFNEKVLQIIDAQQATQRAGDGGLGCCLAVLDIDHFKRVNDQFGHLYGDEILVLFARAMTEAFRGADLLFRVGGEEFVVVLKDLDLAQALVVLQRFRQMIEERSFPQVGRITTSIGASLIVAGDSPTSVIGRADQALYYAKGHGRNQVHAYEHLLAEGRLVVTKHESEAEFF